jgi:hypothetical protein
MTTSLNLLASYRKFVSAQANAKQDFTQLILTVKAGIGNPWDSNYMVLHRRKLENFLARRPCIKNLAVGISRTHKGSRGKHRKAYRQGLWDRTVCPM